MLSWSYKIALLADLVAILVALYFIVADYLKSSRHFRYGLLSLVTLLMCGWVGFSYFLYTSGFQRIGSTMAWVTAFPIMGYGLIILLFIILKPDMR
jgi:hypothetical protein